MEALVAAQGPPQLARLHRDLLHRRALDADLRASYTLNPTILGIEDCDALLLVGTNPRIEAPLLNARIRKLVRRRGLQVASVGKASDLTYEVSQLGDSASALSDLLAGKSPFAATLKSAKKPAIIVGTGALTRPAAPAVSALASAARDELGCLADGWNGYGVLQTPARPWVRSMSASCLGRRRRAPSTARSSTCSAPTICRRSASRPLSSIRATTAMRARSGRTWSCRARRTRRSPRRTSTRRAASSARRVRSTRRVMRVRTGRSLWRSRRCSAMPLRV